MKQMITKKEYIAPEAGSRLWNRSFCLVIILSCALNFGNYFLGSSLSLWVVDQGARNSTYGIIHSCFSLVVLFMRPIAGWIVDHGNRRAAFVVSTAMFALTMILMLYAPVFGVFVAMRMLQGIGNGCASSISHASAYDYIPPDKMDRGIGYVAMSSSLLSALTATFSVKTYNSHGPGTLVFWSVVALGVSAALSFAVVFRAPSERKKFRLREVFVLSKLFEARAVLPSLIAGFSVNIGFGLRSYIILFGRSMGISNPGWFTTISAIGLIAVRLGLDAIRRTEKSTYRRVMTAFVVFAVYLVILYLCNGSRLFFFAAILWAVVYGILTPELQSLAIQSAPLPRRGACSSTFFSFTDVGMILGSLLGGVVADWKGYHVMFLCAIIPVVFCAVLFMFWWRKKSASPERKR